MTLHLGVIGAGAIGQDHIRRCSTTLAGATIVAVSDIDPDRARQALQICNPAGQVHQDGHALIRAPDVDAVLVTSWGPTHAEFVLSALAEGKFVFCEKPLATTAADCRAIVDAEIALGRRLVQVGFMRPYDEGYRALKRVLASGTIGEALMVHCAHRNPTVPPAYTTDMAITDTLIHELDVLRFLLDQDYVSAQVIFPRVSPHARPHLRDPQIVLLETDRGVRIDVEIFVNCRYGYDIACTIVGETGIASLPEPAAVALRHDARASSEILTDWKQRFIDAYDTELQDFIDGCAAGAPTGPSAWDGYAAAIAADACVQAQTTGGVVPIRMPDRPAFYGART